MSTRFILFLALVLWYFFSTYWYVCHINDNGCNCFTKQATIPALLIQDNDKQVVSIRDNFKFTQSDATPVISAPVQAGLNTLATYLQQNPQRALVISGQYAPNETNSTPFDNLGLARADALKRQLMAMGLPDTRLQTSAKPVGNMPLFSDNSFFGGYDFAFTDAGPTEALPRFLVLDGSNTVVDVAENFTFSPSDAKPNMSTQVQQGLVSLTNYLKTNPNKTLTLTGNYGANEKNNTMFDNLGLARADAIKQQLVAAGVKADNIQTTSRQNDALPVASNKQLTGALAFNIGNLAEITLPTFTVKDGSETVVDIKDNFSFKLSSGKADMSKEVQNGMASVAQYLKMHPDRRLKLSGSYTPDEKNGTVFPNLGIARADALKKQLVALGIDAGRIDTDAKQDAQLAIQNGSIIGGIDWVLQVTAAKQQDLTAESRTLYFDTGKANLGMTDELRQYFKDVKTYLEQDPKSTVNLTGHTDNAGSQAANQKLGLKRANEVKQQLTRIGIAAKRINTASKGQTEPVKSNDSAEGKQANRRVEMLVQ